MMSERPFNFDLEQMQKAVAGPSIKLPRGLARAKQLRQYLRDHKALDLHEDFSSAEVVRGLIL